MGKKLQYLMIHCTATPEGMAVTSAKIREMHMAKPPKGRGWAQVGYADMIHLNGMVENLVKYDGDDEVDSWEITNGALGMNDVTRHVVYVGGMDVDNKSAKDTRTREQLMALANYVKQTIAQHPNIQVLGHNQVAAKACPSFNVPVWLKAVGISYKNIYKA